MKLMLSILAFALTVAVSASADTNNANTEAVEAKAAAVAEQSAGLLQLSGTVLDVESNETLAGVFIQFDGVKIYSDLEGNFTMTGIKPGLHTIKAELISYDPVELEINVQADRKVNISLSQK